jgi:hypothetical protein
VPVRRREASGKLTAVGSKGSAWAPSAVLRPTLQMLFGVQRAVPDALAEAPAQVHAPAARGTGTAATKLPYADQIQRSFGRHDISGVQAHVGGKASASEQEMDARAYATGAHVVLGEGADLHTVAGERIAHSDRYLGHHDFRSSLRGTPTHNGVTVEAFPVGTFPSDVGTFNYRAVPGISGDSSGTWTLCIVDIDGFGDTGVLSAWSVHD